jgi:hypothetical protein
MNIYKIREAKVGVDRPQEVLGECSFSNISMEEPIREKWDDLRQFDQIFLIEAGFQTHTRPHLDLIPNSSSDSTQLASKYDIPNI